MHIVEKEQYLDKLEELIIKKKLTRQDVEKKVKLINSIADSLQNASKKESKSLKKQLNSGEADVKLLEDKKYVIEFFYDKEEKKIILQNIVEYVKKNQRSHICMDVILSLYAGSQLWKYSNETWLNIISLVVIFVLNSLTVYFYLKEKNNTYSIIGKDWLDKLLLSLNHLNKIEIFRIFRTLLFFVLFLFYSVLLSIEVFRSEQIFIYAVCSITSLVMLIRNFFKLSKLNFFYFIVLLLLAMLGASVKPENWEAIVALIAIVSLLFSDDIWKISPSFENPLEGKYQSKNNKKIVERNIFKYKLNISVLSFILFVAIELLGNKVIVGNILFGQQVKCINEINLLLVKGLDRFLICSILIFLYLLLKKLRKYLLGKGIEFEKPLFDRLFQFVYKDIKLSSPIIKSNIKIDKRLANNFEPKTLIKNLEDLPDNIIVIMDKPVKNGQNTLFIQYSDGSEVLKKEVQITLENRE